MTLTSRKQVVIDGKNVPCTFVRSDHVQCLFLGSMRFQVTVAILDATVERFLDDLEEPLGEMIL